MSHTGRYTYAPTPAPRPRAVPLPLLLAVLAGLIFLGLAVPLDQAPDKAPVFPPATSAGSQAEALAQARIDGFRAGYATAVDQGCSAAPTVLVYPLAAR